MPEYLYILRLASAYSGMMTPMVENSAQVSDVDKSTHARFTVISQPQAQPSRAVTSRRDGRENNLEVTRTFVTLGKRRQQQKQIH